MQSDGLPMQNNDLLSREEQICAKFLGCAFVLQVRGVCVMLCSCYVEVANSVVRNRMRN